MVIGLGQGGTVALAPLTHCISGQDQTEDFGIVLLQPGGQGRSHIVTHMAEQIDQGKDLAVTIEQTGSGIGGVALPGHPLVPIVVWIGGGLAHNGVDPGVFPWRLVVVSVNGDVPSHEGDGTLGERPQATVPLPKTSPSELPSVPTPRKDALVTTSWIHLAGIAGAGALGALARFGLSGLLHRWQPGGFLTGTVVVNLLGCLLFGFFWALLGHRIPLAAPLRVTLFVGFLGSFTTFSTFAFEIHHLFDRGEPGLAVATILLQVLGGLGLTWLGLTLGRALV